MILLGLMFSPREEEKLRMIKKHKSVNATNSIQGPRAKNDLWQLFPNQKMTFSSYLVSDIIRIALIK